MARLLHFASPQHIEFVEQDDPQLLPNQVRVATMYSGISAGTDLTWFNHTNPKLSRAWNKTHNTFVAVDISNGYSAEAQAELLAPGYEQVGRVIELGSEVDSLQIGQIIFGAWGHKDRGVVDAAVASDCVMHDVDPILGVFARTGIIALNGVLDGQVNLGEAAAVFGLGVIGQLTAQIAHLSGATVVGSDLIPSRREMLTKLNPDIAVTNTDSKASDQLREITNGLGADVCFEVTGSTAALHEAIRACARAARVVSIGFYQGEAKQLFLGEEFHHNRISIIASQIGSVPPHLQHRWDRARLNRVFADMLHRKRLSLAPLITHVSPFDEAQDAFDLVDRAPDQVMQAVFEFPENLLG